MKCLLSRTVFIASALAPILSVSARVGGVDGGGGVSVATSQGKMLLDFAASPNPNKIKRVNGEKFPIHFRRLINTDFSLVTPDLAHMQSAALLKERLKLWQESSPLMIGLARQALNSMEFLASKKGFNVKPTKEVDRRFPIENTEYIARYACFDLVCGSLIAVERFEEIDLLSQAGLLLHEGLRHIQRTVLNSFTDAQIESFTNTVFLSTPTESESLDKANLYGDGLKSLFLLSQTSTDIFTRNMKARIEIIADKCGWDIRANSGYDSLNSIDETQSVKVYQAINRFLEDNFETLYQCDIKSDSHSTAAADLITLSRDTYWSALDAALGTNDMLYSSLHRSAKSGTELADPFF